MLQRGKTVSYVKQTFSFTKYSLNVLREIRRKFKTKTNTHKQKKSMRTALCAKRTLLELMGRFYLTIPKSSDKILSSKTILCLMIFVAL